MCGIVGLRLKNAALEPSLGRLLVPMLDVLASRGPDSTGVAIYAQQADRDVIEYSLRAPLLSYDWDSLSKELASQVGEAVEVRPSIRDATLASKAFPKAFLEALHRVAPAISVFGYGNAIQVIKDVGPASEVCERYGVEKMSGYQAIGHTRMATESAVTIEHSHPFAPAADLALVHNGSFSNYASVRRDLLDQGVSFDTDNDSEVAARFIAERLAAGDDLSEALRGVLKVFDGFFTLLVATKDEIAVVRDSFACKPMVVADTADYVAFGTEYVALADLPGIDKAEVFEPKPEEIYSWGR